MFEKANLWLGRHSFPFPPSAQYRMTPIKNSSLSEILFISSIAVFMISVWRRILSFFLAMAPRRAPAILFAVIFCFWAFERPTSFNQRDIVDFATGTTFRISEIVFPSLRRVMTFSFSRVLVIIQKNDASILASPLIFVNERSQAKLWISFGLSEHPKERKLERELFDEGVLLACHSVEEGEERV